MPAIAALTVNDGQATPVAHTFSPVGVDGGIAEFVDRATGIAIGFPVVTISVRKPSKASRTYKVTRKIVLPVLEVVSNSTVTGIMPAPTRAYELLCNTEWVLPERCTLQDRKNIIAYAKNIDALASVTACVQDLEPYWG